jgi:hypothetical protein
MAKGSINVCAEKNLSADRQVHRLQFVAMGSNPVRAAAKRVVEKPVAIFLVYTRFQAGALSHYQPRSCGGNHTLYQQFCSGEA